MKIPLVAFGLVQFTEFHYYLSALTTAIGLSGKTEKCRSIRESAPDAAMKLAPTALGVQERGFLLIGNLLSIPGDIALALSVVLRVRELVCGTRGLLFWPIVEGCHLWKKRPVTQKSDRELKNGLENKSGLSRNRAVTYRRC